MNEKAFRQLQIDKEYKSLIRPLNRSEYAQLELNLVVDGCRDPIIAWDGVIVDGHNRYEICNRLQIPYSVQDMSFDCRADVIVWICSNQLGRRNITEESRKYLIGKRYEAEKVLNKNKNSVGSNQYSQHGSSSYVSSNVESSRRTANRIAEQYHVSAGAVLKYSRYCQAIDDVAEVAKVLPSKILSGEYKISHENLVELAQMDAKSIRQLDEKIEAGEYPYLRYSDSRKSLLSVEHQARKRGPTVVTPEIKKMPEFDPDAEVNGLALTMPTWVRSVLRVRQQADLAAITPAAKSKLETALIELQFETQELLKAIKENSNA